MKDISEQLRDWLTRIARHDDSRAFRSLFELFYPELMRFALFYVKVRESAEEIVQDVFLKLWQLRATLLFIANIRSYLFSATRNQCLNYLQKKSNLTVVRFDDLPTDDPIGFDDDPHQKLEYIELQNRIALAVDSLPPQCRLIFQLVKEQGFSYKEVGELLTLSPRTVETQIGIALHKLATVLAMSS